MSVRKVAFVEDEVYHICNRGVDKRTIFLDKNDSFRFVHDLYEFNDESPATNLYYRQPLLSSYEASPRKRKNPIVELLAFVLMPNHYHLLIRQQREAGITDFLHRLGTGYAMYFNQKYQRTGALFQGPFRAVMVEHEAHFLYLPFYIHANPLDLKFPEWRTRRLKRAREALRYLKTYRWSSFPDYVGVKNFPSVTERSFLTNIFGAPKSFEATTMSLLSDVDFAIIENVALEPLDAPL